MAESTTSNRDSQTDIYAQGDIIAVMKKHTGEHTSSTVQARVESRCLLVASPVFGDKIGHAVTNPTQRTLDKAIMIYFFDDDDDFQALVTLFRVIHHEHHLLQDS